MLGRARLTRVCARSIVRCLCVSVPARTLVLVRLCGCTSCACAFQDVFLVPVERGDIVLLGATTENPSFEINGALLSRCRVVRLAKLPGEAVDSILRRALAREYGGGMAVHDDVLTQLAAAADGDARCALNALELAIAFERGRGSNEVREDAVREALQRRTLLYDKAGDQHYALISALHKSMRGSDVDAALYWLGRMLAGGEDPLYIVRRLVRFASEDVGLADPQALVQALAAQQAVSFIGMPEAEVCIAQAVAFLARAPKSIAVYRAVQAVNAIIAEHPQGREPVPMHLVNAPTVWMRNEGFGAGYVYPPDASAAEAAAQNYLPEALVGTRFFDESS